MELLLTGILLTAFGIMPSGLYWWSNLSMICVVRMCFSFLYCSYFMTCDWPFLKFLGSFVLEAKIRDHFIPQVVHFRYFFISLTKCVEIERWLGDQPTYRLSRLDEINTFRCNLWSLSCYQTQQKLLLDSYNTSVVMLYMCCEWFTTKCQQLQKINITVNSDVQGSQCCLWHIKQHN